MVAGEGVALAVAVVSPAGELCARLLGSVHSPGTCRSTQGPAQGLSSGWHRGLSTASPALHCRSWMEFAEGRTEA